MDEEIVPAGNISTGYTSDDRGIVRTSVGRSGGVVLLTSMIVCVGTVEEAIVEDAEATGLEIGVPGAATKGVAALMVLDVAATEVSREGVVLGVGDRND